MPRENLFTGPSHVESGHADFLLRTELLRDNAELFDQFIREWGEEYTLMDMMLSLGWGNSKGYSTPYITHGLDTEDERKFTVGAIVTPQSAAGGNVVIAVTAADMKTQTGDDGTSRSFSRGRVFEQLIAPNGSKWKIVAKNTSVNPHQYTLAPRLKTQTQAGVAVNTTFQILAPTTAEAGKQPNGLVGDFDRYRNKFAIIKETDLASGSNLTTRVRDIWQAVPGKPNTYVAIGLEEAEMRHNKNISRILVHAEMSDNWTTFSEPFDEDVLEHSTEGFLAAAAYGKQMTYDEAAGYDIDDFQRVVSYYRSKRLPATDFMVLQGNKVAGYAQTALLEFAKAYSTDSLMAKKYFGTRYGVGERFTADQMFAAIGFKGIQFNNYNFIFRDFTELNFPEEQGFTFDKNQYFIPMKTYRDSLNDKLSYPALQLCHRELNGYSRRMEVWKNGSAPARIVNTSEWDVQSNYFRSEVALRTTAAGLIVTQSGSNVDA